MAMFADSLLWVINMFCLIWPLMSARVEVNRLKWENSHWINSSEVKQLLLFAVMTQAAGIYWRCLIMYYLHWGMIKMQITWCFNTRLATETAVWCSSQFAHLSHTSRLSQNKKKIMFVPSALKRYNFSVFLIRISKVAYLVITWIYKIFLSY